MSYTLRGRLETRLATVLWPLLAASGLAAVLGAWWPLELAGLMVGVGLALDVALYHPLLPYQAAWLALPIGLLELGAVMGLVRAAGIEAPLAASVALFAGAWLLAQVAGQAVFPFVRLSYGEDGGELGRAGPVFAGAVITVFVGAGAAAWALRPPGDCELPGNARHGLACVSVADEVGLAFEGRFGLATDLGASGLSPKQLQMSRDMQRNMGNGAAAGDYDGDGDLDVYLLGQRGRGNRLFRNDLDGAGQRRFTDVTTRARVGDRGMSRVAHFADLDADGHLDLVLANDYVPEEGMSPSRIYRNLGDGTFADVTSESGFDPFGYIVGGVSLTDFDDDGLLDIYISYWTMDLGPLPSLGASGPSLPGANRLYRNLGDFRFEDVTSEVGLGFRGNGFTSVFVDFDRDGDQDLYLATDLGQPDVYYENEGGRFRDASEEVGVGHTGNDMGIALADVDGNGVLDVYATNITDPAGTFGATQGNALLLGRLREDGQLVFTDVARARGVDDTAWGWGTAFVDVDLDGDLDLFSVQGMDQVVMDASPALQAARARLFVRDDSGAFTRAENVGFDVSGDQRSLVVFDYDRDGDPDFLISQVGENVKLLENRSSVGNWLTVIPRATPGHAVQGAVVSVVAGDRTESQVVLAGGSYLAGPPAEVYFGLGAAEHADEVRVTWPDGATSTLQHVAGNRIVRPEHPPD
jgi:hypothetical protein